MGWAPHRAQTCDKYGVWMSFCQGGEQEEGTALCKLKFLFQRWKESDKLLTNQDWPCRPREDKCTGGFSAFQRWMNLAKQNQRKLYPPTFVVASCLSVEA